MSGKKLSKRSTIKAGDRELVLCPMCVKHPVLEDDESICWRCRKQGTNGTTSWESQ